MVPLSMTLSHLGPGFQGHDIIWSRISKDKAHQYETIANVSNGTMFLATLTDL